jgi:hypothetical protein
VLKMCSAGNDTASRLWNAPPPPPRQPRPLEPVWAMRRGCEQTDCALLGHGECGWEIVLLRKGEWFCGHQWTTRALALADADEHRRELDRNRGLPLVC